jgi:hypothetical protein
MAESPATNPQPDPELTEVDINDELDRVKAERDALAEKVVKQDKNRRRGGRLRRYTAVLLVVLTALMVSVATTLVWAHRTVLNTDRYVATVAPLGSDPAVTNAVATGLTNQVYAAINPQTQIQQALPKRISFLAGPLSGEVKSLLGNAFHKVLDSPQFGTLWTDANRFAHTQLVAVLRGKSKSITTENGNVVLNLVPLLNTALQSIQPQISAIVGKDVKLPTISGNELPAVACQKISSALSRPLPQTCGQIPLFPADKLKTVQQSVTRFDRIAWLTLILAPVLFILALVASPRRRRTLLQLTISSGFLLVVIRRLCMYLEGRLTSAAKPENRDAAHAIISQVLGRYFLVTGWLVAILLVVAVLALITGPYRWARAVRHGLWVGISTVGSTIAHLAGAASGKAQDQSTRRWVGQHSGLLQIAGVVVIGLIALIVNLSPLVLLVLAIVLAAYLLGIHWLGDATDTSPAEVAEVDLTKRAPEGSTPAATVTPSQRGSSLPAAEGAKDEPADRGV